MFNKGRAILAGVGLRKDEDFDLWTALVSGLSSQQLANDPGGDRYVRLIDDAVAVFSDHVFEALELAYQPSACIGFQQDLLSPGPRFRPNYLIPQLVGASTAATALQRSRSAESKPAPPCHDGAIIDSD